MNAPLTPAEANTLPSPVSGGGEIPSVAFLQMIERAARDPAVDIDKLDRLLLMRERENARVAEQAFNAALAEAQTAMHPVATDSDNPQTGSRYASYAALDRAVRPIYTMHGFALSFNTADAPGSEQARILCDVSHVGGHTRRCHIDMPVDGKGARGGDVMSKTHAMGSGVSYGMRYLLRMIFNLAIDYDDDGNAAGGRAQTERPRTIVPAPKHRLRQGGISERAIAARVARAWEPRRSEPFLASEAGKEFRRGPPEPPPHDFVPDGPGETSAKAINRRLYPMDDELPSDLGPPKLDCTEQDGMPAFLDRRKAKGAAEATYLDLVGGGQ
jgi:ERF superfamily